jgi:hypothetical protein
VRGCRTYAGTTCATPPRRSCSLTVYAAVLRFRWEGEFEAVKVELHRTTFGGIAYGNYIVLRSRNYRRVVEQGESYILVNLEGPVPDSVRPGTYECRYARCALFRSAVGRFCSRTSATSASGSVEKNSRPSAERIRSGISRFGGRTVVGSKWDQLYEDRRSEVRPHGTFRPIGLRNQVDPRAPWHIGARMSAPTKGHVLAKRSGT